VKQTEKRLREILDQLPEAQQRALLEYAEFLVSRQAADPRAREPLDIPRPEDESVVLAIKRLRATYPMLDPAKLLNETYELMTQHTVKGRDRVEVIDELELVFRRHYDRLTGKSGE
jgi:hypothetical protein